MKNKNDKQSLTGYLHGFDKRTFETRSIDFDVLKIIQKIRLSGEKTKKLKRTERKTRD